MAKDSPEHLVKVIGFDRDGRLYMVHGGKAISELTFAGRPEHILRLAKDLTHAVGTMHERGMAHRDIGINNVVVDGDGVLRVIDFGMSRHVSHHHRCGEAPVDMQQAQAAYTACVTSLWFRAPELFFRDKRWAYDPFKIDAWSVGVVLVHLLGGFPKLCQDTDGTQRTAIADLDCDRVIEHLRRTHPGSWVPRLEYFLRGFLRVDPSERLSVVDADHVFDAARAAARRTADMQAVRQTNLYPARLVRPRAHAVASITRFFRGRDRDRDRDGDCDRCVDDDDDDDDLVHHYRTSAMACAILDAYLRHLSAPPRGAAVAVDWHNVPPACAGLANKLLDSDHLHVPDILAEFGAEGASTPRVVAAEKDILHLLDGRLIYETVDDHLPVIDQATPEFKDVKDVALRVGADVPCATLADAIVQTYRGVPTSPLAHELRRHVVLQRQSRSKQSPRPMGIKPHHRPNASEGVVSI
jgi:hypothetical protein